MVSINIRESPLKKYGGIVSRSSGLLISHIPSHSEVVWVDPSRLCSMLTQRWWGWGERVPPTLKNGITLYTLCCNLFFSHNISNTFPRSAHMFVVLFFFSTFFPHLFFNWRKIALQCCIGFCWTIMQISYNYTYIPSLLSLPALPRSHSSWSSQSTSLGSLCYIATSHQL